MTFLEKLRKFSEPVCFDPWSYIRALIEGSTDAVFTVLTLIIFEKISYALLMQQDDIFFRLVTFYAVSMAVYAFLKFIVMRRWGWSELYRSIQEFWANKYLRKYITADFNDTEKIGTGRFISIYERGIQKWNEIYYHFFSSDIQMIIISLYAIVRLFFIGTLYGIIIIAIICSFLFISYLLDTYYIIPSRRKRTEKEVELTHLTVRLFMSKSEFLQSNVLDRELSKMSWIANDFYRLNAPLDTGIWWLFLLVRIIGFTLRMIVYIAVGWAIFRTEQNFAVFGVYIILIWYIETSLRALYDTFRSFTRDIGKVEKLWSTFDSLTPIKWYDSGKVFASKKQDILIDAISYGYGEKNVFEKFSLTIAHGKKTAFVWASGGGKTTLMKLIAGYLHPEKGSISIMGNKLDETALKSYYPHIGYLTQDPSVFDATIRENLVSATSTSSVMSTESSVPMTTTRHPARKLWKTEQDFSLRSTPLEMTEAQELEQKLHEALRLAHCDFVFELEKGLDTEIGERGVRLSWWQKQRLAIAKIFLKNPEIILLDEPTSALDSFSEEQITKALDELFIGRTVIIVAHRLQTVKKSDDIIVIEWWEVVERGDHSDLVAKWGIYYKMLELQSGF